MKRLEHLSMPLGMIGVVIYLIHTFLGNLLWKEYNPVTMDISSLTATGAPNASLLRIFTILYGICIVLFAIGMVLKSIRKYNTTVRIAYIVLLIMELISLLGYALFPLEGDKTIMTFQNVMHIIVTSVVVFTTILFGFILAIGYSKEQETKRIGKFVLVMAIIITIMGLLNPMVMNLSINVLGVTERLVIYSLHLLVFSLSYYYTFSKLEKDNE